MNYQRSLIISKYISHILYPFIMTDLMISFILKPCDLKFGMHVVKTLFFFMKSADNTYYTYFLIFQTYVASGQCFIQVRVRPLSIYIGPKTGLGPVTSVQVTCICMQSYLIKLVIYVRKAFQDLVKTGPRNPLIFS